MTPEPIVSVQFTIAQVQALAGLIDAGLRATGLRAAKDAAALMDIIETAVKAASEPQEGKDKANGQHHAHG